MGTIATVLIRNKKNGKTRRINENEWAHDLGKGKYNGWERAGGERHGDADEAARISLDAEAAKAQKIADDEAADAAEREAKALEDADFAALDEGTEGDDTESTDEPAGDEDTEGEK